MPDRINTVSLGAQPGKRAYRQGRKAYAHCLNRKTSEETLKRVPFSKEKKAGTELLVPETSENMQPGQPDASTEEQLFLTPGDAAVIAGCTPSTIRRWVQSGKITAVYLPSGRIYIAQSELEWFLSANCPAGNERDSDEAKSDHTRRKGVQSHGVSGKTRQ